MPIHVKNKERKYMQFTLDCDRRDGHDEIRAAQNQSMISRFAQMAKVCIYALSPLCKEYGYINDKRK